jgi:hypothetical protein
MEEHMASERQSVSVEIDGKTHAGSYTVSGKVITVSYGGRTKTTQIGGTPQATIARQLLRELVRSK